MKTWMISSLAYLVLAPIIGGLSVGLDRIITARMQKRIGPPILQPFYDVFKLFSKQRSMVEKFQLFYVFCFTLFMIIAGVIFFAGLDLLLVFFTMTLANIFLILGAYSTSSPMSFIGAERELILMVAYEPMVMLTIVGFYIVTGSFHISHIAVFDKLPIILFLPGCFIGLLVVMIIKFNKSPYDLSASHHPHQELVKGITTDFSGPVLALIEIAHWYEYVFLFGFLFLFFSFNWIVGIIAVTVFFEIIILVDNVFARFKYEFVVKSLWILTMILGFGNIIVLYVLFYFTDFAKSFLKI